MTGRGEGGATKVTLWFTYSEYDGWQFNHLERGVAKHTPLSTCPTQRWWDRASWRFRNAELVNGRVINEGALQRTVRSPKKLRGGCGA